MMQQGIVFDISPYMIEGGPEIRTNVFLKGCPLHCVWCGNAYGLNSARQLAFLPHKCVGCGACVDACPTGAISLWNGKTATDFSKCVNSLACVSKCSCGARLTVGTQYTSDEIVAIVEKNRMFSRNGQGGITLSGGEILLQPKFAAEILQKCRDSGIHTAIETSGYAQWENLQNILLYTDVAFIGCKLIDRAGHKRYTGVDNTLILENIRKTAQFCYDHGTDLIVRLPLVPGINDSTKNILETVEFVKSLTGRIELNILPYHNDGVNKYEHLGMACPGTDIQPHTEDALAQVQKLLGKTGAIYSIGGYD